MVEEILMLETKQAQIAEGGDANKPTDCLPSANPLPFEKPFRNTSTKNLEDAQSKRSRNKLPHTFEQRDEQTTLLCNSSLSNYQMGVSGIEKSASKGISLALGLHQNNRFESSRSFPVNISHQFGLERSSQPYLRNGSEAQNQNSGKGLRVHVLHDFSSWSTLFNSNAWFRSPAKFTYSILNWMKSISKRERWEKVWFQMNIVDKYSAIFDIKLYAIASCVCMHYPLLIQSNVSLQGKYWRPRTK